jgi:hypothetical protein
MLLISLFCLLSVGLAVSQAQSEDNLYDSVPVSELDPAFAVEWMQLLYDRIQVEAVSAPGASRLYAYAGVTLYESILPGMLDNVSLAGQVNDLPELSWPDEEETLDWASVANAALHTVLSGLFADGQPETLAAFDALRAEQMAERSAELDEALVERSLAYGDLVGEELLVWVAADGYAETREMPFVLLTGEDWLWQPTREGQEAVEPYWGQIRPFALTHNDQCAVYPNMPFSTEEDSVFYAQVMEVKEVGDNLTPEQQDIAKFWIDTPGETGTPAGHWVLIQNQLVEQLDLNLNQTAEMYALVGMALGDSFISCWSLKYQINLLRPVTYINEHISRRWRSYLETPGFPEYPSGHSVVSAAAAETLTSLFGTVAFTSRNMTADGMRERSFTSFEAAANEAAISRLYGGIHYRSAIENGMRQGRCVGTSVIENVTMRYIGQGE